MGRISKYPDELRERAVRMVAEVRPQYPSQWAAITAVAGMLGIGTPETLRTWIRRAEVDTGQRPGVTSQMAEENKALRKQVAELRRANEILKAAAIFLGPSSTGPGDGDPFHHRTQGPAGVWRRRRGRTALGCRAHVCRAF
jgi:transposase